MALRAGYKGIKSDMIDAIKSLISLGVKSLGTMFNVSNKGVLTVKKATGSAAGIVQPDGTTITIDNGIISAEGGGGITYSTTEFDSGMKWTDGRTVYGKTYELETVSSNNQLVDTLGDIIPIYYTGMYHYQNGADVAYLPLYGGAHDINGWVEVIPTSGEVKLRINYNSRATNVKFTLFYLKQEV